MPPFRGHQRRWQRLLTAGAVAGVALLLGASPASAHAELLTTDPAPSAVLAEPPAAVTLRFSQPVGISAGAIRVYDPSSRRVDTGTSRHPDGNGSAVTVALNADLPDAGYVVTWRVLSADGHPIRGAFTFRVGPPGDDAGSRALAGRLLAQQGGSTAVGALFAAARYLTYAGLVVLLGGAAFLLLAWPAGGADRLVARLLWAAWGTVMASGLLALALQGPYAGGLPLSDAADPQVLRDVLDTRFGRALAARLLLALLAAPLLAMVLRRRTTLPAGRRALAASIGTGLLATVSATGHASAGIQVPAALGLDVVHLAAACLWLGGLVVLTVALLRHRADVDGPGVRTAAERFSPLAFGSVVALLLTGAYQSWRQVGTAGALPDTTYGKLLIAKLAGFAGLVALGAAGRRWLRRRPSGEARTLRRSVGLEVALGAGVLAVTALLANAVPARVAYAQPVTRTVSQDGLSVTVVVSRPKAGRTTLHAYTFAATGEVREVAEFTARLRLPERDVGPLEVPFQRAGPGHFTAVDFDIPLAGAWELAMTARLTDVDQVQLTATFTIR